MTPTRARTRVAAATMLAGALALLLPPTAASGTAGLSDRAAQGPAGQGPAGQERAVRDRAGRAVGVGPAPTAGEAAGRAVRSYWTPTRMHAARGVVLRPALRPAGAVPTTIRQTLGDGRAERAGGVSATLDRLWSGRGRAVTGSSWPLPSSALAARTTGKVFFTLGGSDWVCSGSALDSPDGATVLTAGHCVNAGADGAGEYATNWVFVPGYRTAGTAPYGIFPAVSLVTTTGWRTLPDGFDDDVAFAEVGPNAAGQTLVAAVGGQRVGFGRRRGEWVTALGYPAAPPWTGQVLMYCSGRLRPDDVGGSADQGLRCDLTGGSSGGPWLGSFDPRTGAGTVVSVTSFGYVGLTGYLWGPYLGDTAKSLYAAVASTPGV